MYVFKILFLLLGYYGGKKNVGQCARKREYDRPDPGKKPMGGRGGRAGQRYVRPREKMGGKVEPDGEHPESGSLYCAGGKKQNIAHLLDWWGPGHRGQRGGGRGARVRRPSSHVPKYSKEHYLQANCQFVVDDSEDYSIYSANQDLLVEWKYVEEVRLHVSVAPSCPICLHPPNAAKVTRCGHIYCFPCILHYLALSDKKWRSCPICYEPVGKEDLKSVVAISHKEFAIGEEVELQLMRRERDSLLPVPAAAFAQEIIAQPPRLSHPTAATPYAKLLAASKDEASCSVKTFIVAREQRELEQQMEEEGDQPEACFLEEALGLLRIRRESLCGDGAPEACGAALEEGMEALSLSSPEELSSSESLLSFEESLGPVSPVEHEACPLPDDPQAGGRDEAPHSAITVQDLDISQLQPLNANNSAGQVQRNAPKATFYFYQASNGAHIYLHALNVQMLVHEYGALENCPHTLRARVVEKETVAMTEELRMRLRYLRHLPVTCNFDVVEVALCSTQVSQATLALFLDQIETRQRKRNKRAREERKIEKRVQAEEDRMMGRSKGATNIKIESFKQFPSFSEDFPIRASHDVQEGGGGGGEGGSSGSELGCSPNTEALGSSAPNTIGTGMSFAKMIREGQTKAPPPGSEPVDIQGVAWPSLGGSAPKNDWPASQKGSGGRGWEGRSRVSESSCGNCTEEEEEKMAAPPEYRHAFSSAMAKALDAAAASKTSADADVKEGGKRGKKNKKQKKVLLFSSGGLK
ncbi:RING finger protein 10 [Chionoecetes opilio]|uniref:E3 ubiquitin-protein ligase RNF10 n=1 Tax=Chionoecetes opilio TaxID=41210 RepID=A0A8J5D054_CHIOP|nr:RING finger protein 10 [Chionoecetes opilio]